MNCSIFDISSIQVHYIRMKKLFISLISLVIILVGVSLFRANNYYKDKQYYPQTEVEKVTVDKEQVIQHLSQAIQIPTISKDEEPHYDPVTFLAFHQLLESRFPLVTQKSTKHIINQYSLVYEFTGTDTELKPMLFMGHMDVVPVDDDTLSAWTHPPFSGELADGQIWGRGALDDKVTVMALMEAMELQLQNGNQPKRTVYFSFGHDEEIDGKNGAAKVAEFFKAKGTYFDMVLDEGGFIVEDIVKGIDQPIALIGIAEKGFVNVRMNVDSVGGHSSTPPNHTAAGILASAIVKLENNQFPASLEFTNMTYDAIGFYADFGTRLAMANQWLMGPLLKSNLLKDAKNAAGLRTTIAVTMLKGSSKSNILPTRASAVANFRIIPGETWQSVLAEVENIIDDPRVELEVFMNSNPSAVSASDSSQFKILEVTIREFTPETLVTPYLVRGGTDAKYFYQLSDSVYRFLMIKIRPDTLDTVHGIDERILADDYVMSIQYFYELLNKISFKLD
jgi:carboxypeptidase PM20D1